LKAVFLSELTWEETAKLDKEKTFCMIPISSIEQHGLHLPLGTDDIILEHVLKNINNLDLPVNALILILPVIKYGKSIEHLNFPGTISLQLSTLIAITEDIIKSMNFNGFKQFILLNSHGGNTATLHSIVQDLRFKYNVKIYNIDLWASSFFKGADSLIKTNIKNDIHAGEIETSLLSYINLDYIRKNISQENLSTIVELNDYSNDWLSSDVSESGVMGDATNISEKTGEEISNYLMDKIEEILNLIMNSSKNYGSDF